MTTDRIAQAIRHITNRLHRRFLRDAKLLETAVRNIAMFSAQSKEAQRAASEIQLVAEPAAKKHMFQQPERKSPGGVILPDTVKSVEPDTGGRLHDDGSRWLTADPDSLPDDSTRKIVPDVPAEDKNKPGSFENIVQMFNAPAGSRTGKA
jgi:hypothetical protein